MPGKFGDLIRQTLYTQKKEKGIKNIIQYNIMLLVVYSTFVNEIYILHTVLYI